MQDPIKIKVLEIAENAKKAGIEIYPNLYVMVATYNDRVTLYNEVHYTKEEAVAAFQAGVLAITGVAPELWRIKVIACIAAELLENKFKEYADKIAREKKQEKNELMQEIIKTKDLNLLHRSYSRFTNAEILFLHERLTDADANTSLGFNV